MTTARECRELGKECHLKGDWENARQWFLRGACQYHCLECRTNLVRAGCWPSAPNHTENGNLSTSPRLPEDEDDTATIEQQISDHVRHYMELVRLSSHHPTYTYNLACYCARMGDPETAHHWFRKTAQRMAEPPAACSATTFVVSKRHQRLMHKTMHKQLLARAVSSVSSTAAITLPHKKAVSKRKNAASCVVM
jgi:hypothetical protein